MKRFIAFAAILVLLAAMLPLDAHAGWGFLKFWDRKAPGVSYVVVRNLLEEESVTLLVGGTIYDSIPPMDNRMLTFDVLKKFAGNSDRVTIIVAGGTPEGERFSMPIIWKENIRLARTQKEINQQRTLDIHVNYKATAKEY